MSPPLLLENLLATPARYRLLDSNGRVQVEAELTSGEKAALHQFDTHGVTSLSLRINGNCISIYTMLWVCIARVVHMYYSVSTVIAYLCS